MWVDFLRFPAVLLYNQKDVNDTNPDGPSDQPTSAIKHTVVLLYFQKLSSYKIHKPILTVQLASPVGS